LNTLIVEQENKIADLEVEKELTIRKIDDEMISYVTIDEINNVSFAKLERDFLNESQTLFHYKMSTDLKLKEARMVNSSLNKKNSEIRHIEKNISDYDSKNELLRRQINELTLKVSQMKPNRRYKSSLKNSPNVSFRV